MTAPYRLPLFILFATLIGLSGCKSSQNTTASNEDEAGGKSKKGELSNNFAANPEVTALYFDASTYQANENWPKAIEKYKAVLDKAPRHATTHFNLADVYFNMGDYKKAQGFAEDALKYMDEPNPWFYRLMGQVYTRQREHDKAAQVMEDAVAAFPSDTDLMIELAQTYLSQGEYDRVLTLFDRIEQKAGPDPDISQRRVEIYKFTEQEEKALQALKKMVADFPNADEPRQQYVELLMKMGREAEAVAILENSLKDSPGDGFALFSLIEYYKEQGKTDKANALKKQAFDNPKVPLSTKMQYLIEMMRTAQGDADNAEIERYIRSLHKDNPEDALLLAMMGELYMQQEKPDDARRYFKQSLEQDELNKQVWQTLIQLEQNEENWESLASVTDEALILYPNDLNFNYFNGIAHLQNENYKQAKRPLE
ncbi:MAG: tetratricopeptide repeat protein, partial [Bacteroidota bacterium]